MGGSGTADTVSLPIRIEEWPMWSFGENCTRAGAKFDVTCFDAYVWNRFINFY